MKLLLSTGSIFPESTERAFEIAEELGFDGIEYLIDGRDSPKEVLHLSKRYNMPVFSVHTPIRGLKILDAKEYIGELQPEIIVTHPYPRWRSSIFKRHIAALNVPLETICFETPDSHGPRLLNKILYFVSDPTEAYEFAKKEGLSITFDTVHVNAHDKPQELYLEFNGIVKNVHMSDSQGKLKHIPIGDGDLDFSPFYQKTPEYITLELEHGTYEGIKQSINQIRSRINSF